MALTTSTALTFSSLRFDASRTWWEPGMTSNVRVAGGFLRIEGRRGRPGTGGGVQETERGLPVEKASIVNE